MGFSLKMAMRTCGHCGLLRAHFNVVHRDAVVHTAQGARRFYTTMACPDCGGVTVIETTPPGAQMPDVEWRAWPENPDAAHTVEHLPPDVDGYFRDARRVLDAGVPAAAAVQLRRTLEAAAVHHGQTHKVLVERIRALIAAGLVTKPFGEALDLIRKVGNQGAHASDEHVDQETAERALRFTTLFLRNLFEVPAELRLAKGETLTDADGEAEPSANPPA